MVREVLDGGKKIQVVPNRKLDEKFLQPKVNEVLVLDQPELYSEDHSERALK